MPELPETETIARDLDATVRGTHITDVRVTKPDVLRGVSPRGLAKRLTAQRIDRVWRRAKLVVLDLSSADRLVVQPRFTGALLIDDGNLSPREREFSTLELTLTDGRSLHYRDIRRLGTVTLMSPAQWTAYEGQLGIEPLSSVFTSGALADRLSRSRQAIKKVLMDQRVIAGIGNIYATESLWRAKIDPSRPAMTIDGDESRVLRDEIVAVLTASIAERGTSFRDYRDALGERGNFAARLDAYGRAGLPCPRCGARLVGTDAIDGRMTVLCFRCQH
jgi:formamidopyrimidine-DNA glycosylase